MAAIYCVTFDRTGRRVITGGDDTMVKVWRTCDGALEWTLCGHTKNVNDLSVSRCNQQVASASSDMTCAIWSLWHGTRLRVFNLVGEVMRVQFLPDDDRVVAITHNGSCRICSMGDDFDVDAGLYPRLSSGACEANALAVGRAPNAFIAVGLNTGHVVVHSVPLIVEQGWTEPCADVDLSPSGEIVCTVFNDDAGQLAVATAFGHVFVLDVGDFAVCHTVVDSRDGRADRATTLIWADRGRLLVTTYGAFVEAWDALTAQPFALVWRQHLHHDDVLAVSLQPALGDILLTVGADGQAFVVDARTGAIVSRFPATDQYRFVDCAVSSGGEWLCATSDMGRLVLFGTGSRRRYAVVPAAQFFLSESADASMHAAPFQSRTLCNADFEAYVIQPAHLLGRQREWLPEAGSDADEDGEETRHRTAPRVEELVDLVASSPPAPPAASPPSAFIQALVAEAAAAVDDDDDDDPWRSGTDTLASDDFSTTASESSHDDSVQATSSDDDLPDDTDLDDDVVIRPRLSESRASGGRPSPRRSLSGSSQSDSADDRVLPRVRRRPPGAAARHRVASPASSPAPDRPSFTRLRRRASDDDAAQASESGNDADDEPIIVRVSKRCRRAQASPSDQAGATGPDRRWLQREAPGTPVGGYVPQVGDRVAYFGEGHWSFLSQLEPTVARQLPDWPWPADATPPPVLFGVVVAIAYRMRFRGARQPVVADLSVQFDDQAGADEPADDDEARPGNASSPTVLIPFYPIDEPDFVVPEWVVEGAVRARWQVGDRFRMWYADVSSWYSGSIVEIGNCRTSPWNCVVVRFDDDDRRVSRHQRHAVLQRVSPWELHRVAESSAAQDDDGIAGDDADRLDRAGQVIARWRSYASARHFRDPVPLDEFPVYDRMIALPMDLGLIERRLSNRYYRRVDAVVADLDLIASNAADFNLPGARIVAQARALVRNITRQLRA
ncbi:Bromo domain-containing protein [Plasmodiophora brassicae]